MSVPKTVVGMPKPVPEGQTLVYNSALDEITAIHNKAINNDYICEVVCGEGRFSYKQMYKDLLFFQY